MDKLNNLESNNPQTQCRVCLSVGRNIYPLGQYKKIFKMLTSTIKNFVNKSRDSTELCWECIAILKKVKEFQRKLKRACKLLPLGNSYKDNLSTLRTQILYDNNTKYVFENGKQTDLPEVKVNLDENDHYDDVNELIQTDSKIIENINKGLKIEKYKTKWAKKRALHNKKPKFRTIACSELVFRRVQIDAINVNNCIETEKLRKRQNKYACYICRKVFKSKNDLSEHIVNHYECTLCGVSCNNERQKRNHLRTHKNIIQCLKCELKFCNRRDFFKHYRDWHEKFICDYCGITFKMRYCIKDHISKRHAPLHCKQCDKIFGRYNSLWLHNKVTHTPGSQPAYCVECDKHYPDVYKYRWHLANSVRHRPRQKVRIPCPDCDKVFSKNIYMTDHYNLVHLKKFKYRCEECDKNYIRNADLVKHKRRIHEGILPPKNKICYICGKGFTTNRILSNHVRTHTGERPYPCTACGARFAQRSALATHKQARRH